MSRFDYLINDFFNVIFCRWTVGCKKTHKFSNLVVRVEARIRNKADYRQFPK